MNSTMYDMPGSLQSCCVDFMCDNLSALCDESCVENPSTSTQIKKLTFKDPDIFFHGELSEQLLQGLCEKGKLTDETLSLFDANVTTLKRVSIHNSWLSAKGLRVLKMHKISELEITGLRSATVNDVIGCLGEWTLLNLRSLNVSNGTFVNSTKFCVVVSLSKLHNLQSLNVSNTEFNKHGLEIIAEDLPCLENLDISSTHIHDISPLRKCKNRLKSLSMYKLLASNQDEVVPVLCELTKLVHLDVSDDLTVQPFVNMNSGKFAIQQLLELKTCLPNLTSLDISGKEGAKEDMIKEYLDHHPSMKFLGLALTPYCEFSMFSNDEAPDFKKSMVITGEANERQILEALRHYVNRSVYVQKSLYTLFRLTGVMIEPREDIIKTVLPAMKSHPKQLGVQMAATACLYNLTKGDVGPKVHPTCLKQVVNLTLTAMENFPNHQQLQKNALLTLCSDRILQDVTFDRYRCAKLVMECLCQFDDPSMNRMSVAICSILAAKPELIKDGSIWGPRGPKWDPPLTNFFFRCAAQKEKLSNSEYNKMYVRRISTQQTSQLGAKVRYMRKMLQLVKTKVDSDTIDITLKFTLSALWNLTDESPATCNVFLNEGGLDLFMTTLQAVNTKDSDVRTDVETKILGLLNNIAEVTKLREYLMREDFLMLSKQLMQATQIDVSYFAAGIIAHLASDGIEKWMVGSEKEEILKELGEVVLKWEQPEGEMVAYRSFNPFFPLLRCYAAPSVQLWAVWAIQHVCTKNSERYCPMLEKEGGAEILRELVKNPSTNKEVTRIAKKILKFGQDRARGLNQCDTKISAKAVPSSDTV